MPDSDLPTWREIERLDKGLKDLADELRSQKTMSREDIVDRVTLVSQGFKDSLLAVQREAKERNELNEKSIASLRTLTERVIFAVIGSLAAGVLSLLIEIIRLLAPRLGDG